MTLDEIFEDESRVPFEGPHGGLALMFDPVSVPPRDDSEHWRRATVAFRAAGFWGSVRVDFFPGALPEFLRRLTQVHSDLWGTVSLESDGGDFKLTVTLGQSGEAMLTGTLQSNVFNGTRLVFEIPTDQSYLAATLLALKSLERPDATHP